MADFRGSNAYLVDDDLTVNKLDQWLESRFTDIFENELNDWVTDKSKWPEKQTLTLFNEWFDVRYFGLVYDLEKTALTKY
jgi:hypothetical protein